MNEELNMSIILDFIFSHKVIEAWGAAAYQLSSFIYKKLYLFTEAGSDYE